MVSRQTHEIAVNDHPIDHIEPALESAGSYREASKHLLYVLEIAYGIVMQSDKPKMAMAAIGSAMGIPAAVRTSPGEYALLNGVTKQAFSKVVTQFLRESQLPPALSCKSEEAKLSYRRASGIPRL
jgi:hypothetical protein